MAQTFKRFEKKYKLNETQYTQLIDALSPYLVADEFACYTVNNIYFDNDHYGVIRNSIEKPVYKEKLRLRSYGSKINTDEIFFELKKKYKKEVFKRRIVTTTEDYENYQQNGTLQDANQQILSEIDYFINTNQAEPKIFLAYDRQAFKGKDDSSIRITFDTNIRFRTENLSLQSCELDEKVFSDDHYLMEIKVLGAMPLWLSEILNSIKVYPTSFSKYGYCYKNYMNVNIAQ